MLLADLFVYRACLSSSSDCPLNFLPGTQNDTRKQMGKELHNQVMAQNIRTVNRSPRRHNE